MKKLIVNADDFGQSAGINKGIIKAHEEGIVTSASLMVRYSASEEAAAYARKNTSLGVGLHIDLGEWIYANQEWQQLYSVVNLDDAFEVKTEIKRQLEKFVELTGRLPTHIDSHQHVHLRTTISTALAEVIDGKNFIVRRCHTAVKYCGSFYGQSGEGAPYHDAITTKGLLEILSNLKDGYTELACHPGLAADVQTMYSQERELEVQTLTDSDIKSFIAANNIQLISFADVKSSNSLCT